MQAERWELSDGLVIRLDIDGKESLSLKVHQLKRSELKCKEEKKKKKDGREGGSEGGNRTGSVLKAGLHLGLDCGL